MSLSGFEPQIFRMWGDRSNQLHNHWGNKGRRFFRERMDFHNITLMARPLHKSLSPKGSWHFGGTSFRCLLLLSSMSELCWDIGKKFKRTEFYSVCWLSFLNKFCVCVCVYVFYFYFSLGTWVPFRGFTYNVEFQTVHSSYQLALFLWFDYKMNFENRYIQCIYLLTLPTLCDLNKGNISRLRWTFVIANIWWAFYKFLLSLQKYSDYILNVLDKMCVCGLFYILLCNIFV